MHTPALRTLCQRVVGICVVAAALALAPLTGGTAFAAPGGLPGTGDSSFAPGGPTANNHCFTPSGTDVNEAFGVTQQLVIFEAPPEAGCGPVSTGEFWTPLASGLLQWVTNTSFDTVPSGYEPSAATPMEDFLSKAETITYEIDSGTAREKTYRYPVQDVVKVDTVDKFYPPGSWPEPYPIAQYLPKLPPLPPGQHTYTVVLQMSAMSCDGFGTDINSGAFNCIGPGAIRVCPPLPFTVEPRKAGRPT